MRVREARAQQSRGWGVVREWAARWHLGAGAAWLRWWAVVLGAAVLATGCATVPGAEDTYSHRRGVARAVPAVGAYLGQVLVRHLGGEWLPRKKLEEVQVRVGRRVWLPFLRVHRYVRSTQSLLDYSLTQLYREAERHRQ